ncbi:MAG: hypothetical protein ACLU9S_01620 [Oscillospiraceae bacterium]
MLNYAGRGRGRGRRQGRSIDILIEETAAAGFQHLRAEGIPAVARALPAHAVDGRAAEWLLALLVRHHQRPAGKAVPGYDYNVSYDCLLDDEQQRFQKTEKIQRRNGR